MDALKLLRDTGFEPRPHRPREVLRARSELAPHQAELSIALAESPLSMILQGRLVGMRIGRRGREFENPSRLHVAVERKILDTGLDILLRPLVGDVIRACRIPSATICQFRIFRRAGRELAAFRYK